MTSSRTSCFKTVAREAAEWYVSLVPGSSIERVAGNGAGGTTVYVRLAGREFRSCFGWATDRYGVSWQLGTADRELAASYASFM